MARNHRSVALTSTVFMTLAAAAAGAQDQTAHAAAPAVGGIEEVVVTARKREESAQDVPVAVAAISAAQIERYDLTSLERVAASIPQLTVGRNSTGSGANITLRGIGSTPTSIGIEQSVATVVRAQFPRGQGRPEAQVIVTPQPSTNMVIVSALGDDQPTVQSLIRLRIATILRIEADADGRRDMQHVAIDIERLAGHPDQAAGQFDQRLFAIQLVDEDDELVAAQPEQALRRPHLHRQPA